MTATDPRPGTQRARRRVLILASIPAHFREMQRVICLLRGSAEFAPVLLVAAPYDNWDRDARAAAAMGAEVYTQQDLIAGRTSPGTDFAESGSAAPAATLVHAAQAASPQAGGVLRSALRKPWRWLYRKYWEARVALSAFAVARLMLVQLLCKTLVMLPIGGKLALRSFVRPGAAEGEAPRAVARELVSEFGKLWEADSVLLPPDYREKRKLFLAAPHFFRAHRFALLVLPEDNYFQKTHFLVHAAKQAGTASVIIPYTVASAAEWVEGFRGISEFRVRGPMRRLMARAFPHWSLEYQGCRLLMPSLEILMNEYLELAPPRPWLLNSGRAEALAVEGPFMANLYGAAGIAPDRMVITGSLADDEMFEQISRGREPWRALLARLGLPQDRPTMLFSLPPDQLAAPGRPQCEFRTYEQFIRSVLDVLCACDGWNVVLSVHPRLELAKIALLRDYPARVAPGSIAALVPHCDLFVACASATIRLAMTAGRPTVNYDAYRYRYSDFAAVPGVLAVEDLGRFRESVEALTRDPERRAEIARAQAAFNASAAMLDGRSGTRLLDLFRRLSQGAG